MFLTKRQKWQEVINMADDDQKQDEKIEEQKEEGQKAADDAQQAAKEAEKSEEAAEKSEEKAEEAAEEAKETAEEVKETVKEKPSQPKVKVSAKLEKIIGEIEKLSVLELSELVKALEEKFGVTAATPVAAAGTGVQAGSADEGVSEQTTFNVILAESGANKISVIKAIRELVPTLGLKEAKDLVDAAPKQVLEGVNKETAQEAKTKLETAGAKVELK